MAVYWNKIRWVIAFIGALWIIEIVNLLTGHRLNDAFGLVPRRAEGLIGVPAMPLLHGSLTHVAANTLPVLLLGGLLALTARRRVWLINTVIVALGGLAVWLLGRPAIHIGASGLIFGWFGFLVARGFYDRSFVTAIIGLGVGVVYGGLALGILPRQPGVSWEAHLFGLSAGVAAAALIPVPVDDPKDAARETP